MVDFAPQLQAAGGLVPLLFLPEALVGIFEGEVAPPVLIGLLCV